MSDQAGAYEQKDSVLVQGALVEQNVAVEALMRRLQCVPRFLAALNRRSGRPLVAEDLADLTQDVLIILWRKLDQFPPGASIEAWAYRVCRFELMNLVRKRRRRAAKLPEIAEKSYDDPNDGQTNPWRFEEVHKGLELLDHEEREVVWSKHFNNVTFEELSARMGVSESTLKTRYYRGLTKLRAYLAGRGVEGVDG